ncbi:hypothetical protein PIB30_044204 [Stylosanthes scabra]|uniref:Uncharacterized protein n=1 Tax=Stylosanthes scabra TaxID=79078 RepID=A0ABU6SGG2_9FABA|nr:hypothetical protein [Stylosanthes scabra]
MAGKESTLEVDHKYMEFLGTLLATRRASHRRHIFLPRISRFGTPFKVLWTIIKGSDLNIGAVCGDSYSRDKKRSAGDPSERWTTKYHSTMRKQPTATRNRLRKRKSIKGTKPSSS